MRIAMPLMLLTLVGGFFAGTYYSEKATASPAEMPVSVTDER